MPKTAKGWHGLEKYCDKIEQNCWRQIEIQYAVALKKAISDYADFFQKVQDVQKGKIKPPDFYTKQGKEAVEKWKQGFILQLAAKGNIAHHIAEELANTGQKVPAVIRDSLYEIYENNFNESQAQLKNEFATADIKPTFGMVDKRQAKIIVDKNEGVMSKVAYSSIGTPSVYQHLLQNALFQSTVLGESKDKLIKRIQKAAGVGYKRAKRIAQTERTRVQSQARYQAGEELANQGVKVYNEWRCKMMATSRDTHKDLGGINGHPQRRMVGEKFVLSDGDELEYPGDPNGRACNVINCYCVMIPHVLLRDEYLDADGNIVFKRTKTEQEEELNTDSTGGDAPYYHDIKRTTTKLKAVISENDYEEYCELVSKNETVAHLYDKFDELQTVRFKKEGGVFFGTGIEFGYPDDYYIQDGMNKFRTLAHEFGHYADTFTYKKINFSEAQAVKKIGGYGFRTDVASSSDEFLAALRKDSVAIRANPRDVRMYCFPKRNLTTGVQDAYDGLGLGRIGWGHGDSYYNRFYNHRVKSYYGDHTKEMKALYQSMGFDASNQTKVKNITRDYETASELWANIASAITVGGEELTSLEKFFPNCVQSFRDITKEMEE